MNTIPYSHADRFRYLWAFIRNPERMLFNIIEESAKDNSPLPDYQHFGNPTLPDFLTGYAAGRHQ